MPKIDEDISEKLFEADRQAQLAGLSPLSSDELRKLYHREANRSMGLAPTSGSQSVRNNLPIAGFQGTPAMPNQGGGFADNSGLASLSMGMGGPSQMPQTLNPMGQAQQNYQIPRRPDLTQMAQGQPQGQQGMMGMGQPGQPGMRGFTTNIQIGEDGQVSGINLKRAIQRNMRRQNGQG